MDCKNLDGLKPHEAAQIVPRMRPDEWKAFLEDVRANGVIEPLVIQRDGPVLDGRHRLDAARECGFEVVPYREVELSEREQVDFVIRSAVIRRHLSDDQRAMLANYLREQIGDESKRTRSAKAGAGNRKKGKNLEVTSASKIKERARKQAAEALNVPESKVRKAKEIADESPELADKVLAGDITLKDAQRQVRRKQRTKKIAEIASSGTALDSSVQYPVILLDPPWKYDFIEVDAWKVENHYPTMTTDEICALPVGKLATPDAVLFLWATAPKLADAMRAIEAWGFTYKTCAVWDKVWTGMGNYFRIQHELLLIATKGSIPPPETKARPASVFRVKRSAKHSEKPPLVHKIIERMYPEFPKVELFARAERKNWARWGQEVEANL